MYCFSLVSNRTCSDTESTSNDRNGCDMHRKTVGDNGRLGTLIRLVGKILPATSDECRGVDVTVHDYL